VRGVRRSLSGFRYRVAARRGDQGAAPGTNRLGADAETYLAEARVLASLDHAGIVPVCDLGRTDYGSCYVVSKFMPGGDLAGLSERCRASHEDSADLIVRITDALHFAHQRGLAHNLKTRPPLPSELRPPSLQPECDQFGSLSPAILPPVILSPPVLPLARLIHVPGRLLSYVSPRKPPPAACEATRTIGSGRLSI
jgi:hypothetical protein